MFTALKHRNNPIAFNWSLVRKKPSFVCGLDRTKIAFTTKVESVVKRVLNCGSKLLNLFDRVSVGTNDSETVQVARKYVQAARYTISIENPKLRNQLSRVLCSQRHLAYDYLLAELSIFNRLANTQFTRIFSIISQRSSKQIHTWKLVSVTQIPSASKRIQFPSYFQL